MDIQKRLFYIFVLLLSLCSCKIYASGVGKATDSTEYWEQYWKAYDDSFENSLHFKKGKINLYGYAIVQVPAGYKLLEAAEARLVLEKLWNNPPDSTILGMIIPEGIHLSKDTMNFGITLSYIDAGYIKDGEYNNLDFDAILE